jgi:hypothetical protein
MKHLIVPRKKQKNGFTTKALVYIKKNAFFIKNDKPFFNRHLYLCRKRQDEEVTLLVTLQNQSRNERMAANISDMYCNDIPEYFNVH